MIKVEMQVCYRNSYGRDLCYPACDIARNICKLTGAKTLSNYSLKIAEDLGYEIKPIPYLPSNFDLS